MRHLSIIIAAAALLVGLTFADGAAAIGPGTSCSTGRDLLYKNRAWAQNATVSYYINRTSLPKLNEVSSPSEITRRQNRLIARIRDGARTWNSGKNDCHYSALHGFETAYSGDTTTSGASHVDGKNVIDFAGNITCGSMSGAMLNACTSTSTTGGVTVDHSGRTMVRTTEFDIRFQLTGHTYYDGVGTPPSTMMDVWGLAAHEWGHVVGLADLTDAKDNWQTMYGFLSNTETFPRTLGRSDWLGLSRLYGP